MCACPSHHLSLYCLDCVIWITACQGFTNSGRFGQDALPGVSGQLLLLVPLSIAVVPSPSSPGDTGRQILSRCLPCSRPPWHFSGPLAVPIALPTGGTLSRYWWDGCVPLLCPGLQRVPDSGQWRSAISTEQSGWHVAPSSQYLCIMGFLSWRSYYLLWFSKWKQWVGNYLQDIAKWWKLFSSILLNS